MKVFNKTSGKCHVCGDVLEANRFEADHVMAHAKGGSNHFDNFLPACRTCNNYRWDYLSEEFQWILKIGVWARTQMEKETKIGRIMTEGFMAHEQRRINRQK
ncbi:MAG: HNH endonuclease signature motif containing protein [Cyclobacteriaceae bacterium]